MKKAWQLFENLQEDQGAVLKSKKQYLPSEVFKVPAKISRGENYKGLPYLILDQPRLFEKNDIFAIRTLFWWGNFFSTTLHLSGKYKTSFEDRIISHHAYLLEKEFFVCVHPEQWEHDFEETNYREAAKLTQTEFQSLRGNTFIKIAKKIPIESWDNAGEKLVDDFRQMVELLC